MAEKLAKVEKKERSLIATMARENGVSAVDFLNTVKSMLIKSAEREVSNEELMLFLMVANKYHLNPFTREIHAFISKGKLIPIVGVDGWITLAQNQKSWNGMSMVDSENIIKVGSSKDCPEWSEVTIYRKDMEHPIVIREWLDEVYRNTDPWNKNTKRMLRHKTIIQGFRVAFGLSGIYDADEAERINEMEVIESTCKPHVEMPKAISKPEPEVELESEPETQQEPEQPPDVSKVDEAKELAKKLSWDTEKIANFLGPIYSFGKFEDLSDSQLDKAIDFMKKAVKSKK